MSARMFHDVIAGDPKAAVKHGLTLKARCGAVWVPTFFGEPDKRPDIPDCAECYKPVPGFVYRCYDNSGRLIYVGCSKVSLSRMSNHKRSSWWWSQVDRVVNTVFPSRDYALSRESEMIYELAPLWNVVGMPYSRLSADDYSERLALALELGAPESFVKRLKREYATQHGLQAVS